MAGVVCRCCESLRVGGVGLSCVCAVKVSPCQWPIVPTVEHLYSGHVGSIDFLHEYGGSFRLVLECELAGVLNTEVSLLMNPDYTGSQNYLHVCKHAYAFAASIISLPSVTMQCSIPPSLCWH